MNKMFEIIHGNGYFRIKDTWTSVKWIIYDDLTVYIEVKYDQLINNKKVYEHKCKIDNEKFNKLKEMIEKFKKREIYCATEDGPYFCLYEYIDNNKNTIANIEGLYFGSIIYDILDILYNLIEEWHSIRYDNNGNYLISEWIPIIERDNKK